MTCRIGEDPRAVGSGLILELRTAHREHGPFGFVEVVDAEVEVNLHRRLGSGQVGG